MLTAAYFNAEVGDLRETLAGYQIKIDRNTKTHRAIFIGGQNFARIDKLSENQTRGFSR